MPHRTKDVNAVLVRAHQRRDSAIHVSTADTVLTHPRESTDSTVVVVQQCVGNVNATPASVVCTRYYRTNVTALDTLVMDQRTCVTRRCCESRDCGNASITQAPQ